MLINDSLRGRWFVGYISPTSALNIILTHQLLCTHWINKIYFFIFFFFFDPPFTVAAKQCQTRKQASSKTIIKTLPNIYILFLKKKNIRLVNQTLWRTCYFFFIKYLFAISIYYSPFKKNLHKKKKNFFPFSIFTALGRFLTDRPSVIYHMMVSISVLLCFTPWEWILILFKCWQYWWINRRIENQRKKELTNQIF